MRRMRCLEETTCQYPWRRVISPAGKQSSTMKRAADFKKAMENPEESISVVMGYSAQTGGTEHARRAHSKEQWTIAKVVPDEAISWEEVQNHAAERLAELTYA